ncbi:hypothetical protein BKA62DRAFT_641578 [Auriculariales sp. MPI-PUGE-AT-0066]|nr:hypothetical protein BKA62DRAFT_641578 [Auriculariales sp. MPI-PUGE-AT-0066]
MGAIGDFIYLVTILVVVGAIIVGVLFASNAINGALDSTNQSLKKQGVNISKDGVSVKTNKRGIDRETLLDNTQRGFVTALNNAQFGKKEAQKNVGDFISHRNTPSKSQLH